MNQPVTAAEIKRADKLHSALLFDFIVVHVFLFLLALSMIKSTFVPIYFMVTLSLTLLGFVIFSAQRSLATEPSYFVRCHQLLAAKRAKLFMLLFLITGSFTALMLIGGPKLGMSPIASKALAFGIGQLPFMVALLTLVVLQFDASHQCKAGKIPTSASALLPAAEGQESNGQESNG